MNLKEIFLTAFYAAQGAASAGVRAEAHAPDWDDATVRKNLRIHVLTPGGSPAAESARESKLQKLGERVWPALLEILNSPGPDDGLPVEGSEAPSGREAPISRICSLLHFTGTPPEAYPRLREFARHKNPQIRGDAVWHLAFNTDAAAVAEIRTALRDEDDFVRNQAIFGFCAAGRSEAPPRDEAARKRLSAELFQDVLSAEDFGTTDFPDTVGALIFLDRDRAASVLSTPEYFEPVRSRSYVLAALLEAGLAPPREALLEPILKLEAEPLQGPFRSQYGECLHLLGYHRHEADLPRLEAAFRDLGDRAAIDAGWGLLNWHGIGDRFGDLHEKETRLGFSALNEHEKHCFAVQQLDLAFLEDYIASAAGARWEAALAGLEKMGAVHHAETFRKFLALFPEGKPAVDEAVRQKQTKRLAAEKSGQIDVLNSLWSKASDAVNTEYLTLRYVIANKEGFR